MSQKNEDNVSVMSNLDSDGTSFQIAPFTSFNEMIDVEDFVIHHSEVEKLKVKNMGEVGEGLYRVKKNEIR